LLLEIEMVERSFLEQEHNPSEVKLDPRAERARLQKLFDEARADQQANYPDLYVSTGSASPKETKDLNKAVEDAKAETAKAQGELAALTAKTTGTPAATAGASATQATAAAAPKA
jgi:hypothetical protein